VSLSGRFRDLVSSISPTALSGPVGQRFQYAMSVCLDGLSLAASYAIKARFPATCPPDAIPYLCADRQIQQGPNESLASVTTRLLEWLPIARITGNARSVLLGILSYFTPSSLVAMSTVDDTGFWYSFAEGTALLPLPFPTKAGAIGSWNWDGVTDPFWHAVPFWWRFWVILWPDPLLSWGPSLQKWDDGSTWDAGQDWDYTGPAEIVPAVRAAVKRQKAAHTWCPNILIAYDTSYLQPTSITAKLPNGEWGHWGAVTTQTVSGVSCPVYTPARLAGNLVAYAEGAD
jgi:hypothetical protein